MWRQMPFAAASPFHHSRGQESGYVLAFEVELHSICGLDYSNPLILDGRMVIEANHVVKREFLTVRTLLGCMLVLLEDSQSKALALPYPPTSFSKPS